MQDDRRAFRAALRSGDALAAITAAGALAPLDLLDALELLRVPTEVGDARYPTWANHWYRRVVADNRLGDDAARTVRTLHRMLPEDSDARGVLVTLRTQARAATDVGLSPKAAQLAARRPSRRSTGDPYRISSVARAGPTISTTSARYQGSMTMTISATIPVAAEA